jgi:tripartite-type tricarboxylate transporter receptor subunit TctC
MLARVHLVFAVAIVLSVATVAVRAETYPSKPVRVIVPYGPGGIADVTMRMVAQNLSQHFGQQFFIENRPGAGGVVGMQGAKEAAPDGYTLVMVGGGLTIAKALFKFLPYNIETDFTPISTTASYGLVITTKASSAYKTIKDVIAAAKTHPGSLNWARRSHRNAGRYRRDAQSRRGGCAEIARSAEVLQRRRHGRTRHVVRRSAQAHPDRRRQMGAGDREGGHRETVDKCSTVKSSALSD